MTARRPKLMFLVSEDWYFVSHRLPLARAAMNAGYEVVVACRVTKDRERIEAEGVRVIPIKLRRRLAGPFQEIAALMELVYLFRRERPDVLHQFALKPSAFGSLAALLTGLPAVVTTVAGLGYIFINQSIRARILRPIIRLVFRSLFNRKACRVIVQNQDDFRMLSDRRLVSRDRLTLIPGSGVDTEHFAPSVEPEGTPVAALVSRMLWDKGVGETVEAARELQRRGVALRIAFVGAPDPDNPRCIREEQLRDWQRQGLIEWRGHCDDIAALWRQCHIAVLPSYREGMPKSLLEAAASGRPIVTTDAPGCRDLVEDGKNGLLVPVGSVTELADALQKLAESSELRSTLGQEAQRRVESRYSDAIVTASTLSIYQQMACERVL